jgi:glycosyltransferase involved in cell wall biosynthesis
LGEREKNVARDFKIAPEEKIKIIRHAVPAMEFLEKDEARKAMGLPQDKKIFGTIANFYATKGLQYLIMAAVKIPERQIVAVIGDGPQRDDLEKQIKEAGLNEKIILLGGRDAAAQYLKAFDAFILPSVKEGMPYVILEAMQAGVPIIATDVGNIKEMLADYKNKIIVPPADASVLHEAMRHIAGLAAPPSPHSESFADFIARMKKLYLD